MTDFDPRPPRFAASIAVVAATVGVAFTAPGGLLTFGVAALGLPLLAIGAFRGRRDLVSGGGLLVVAGAVLGGALGAPVSTVVAATAAAFVAWDVGEHGVGLGTQVGARARTRQAVATHAAASALVAGGTAVVAVLVFTAGPSGRPLGALVLLLAGAVLIAVTLTD